MEEPALREPVAAYLDRIQAALRGSLEAAEAGRVAPGIAPAALAAALLAIVEGRYGLARVHWDEAAMRAAIDGGVQRLAAVTRPQA